MSSTSDRFKEVTFGGNMRSFLRNIVICAGIVLGAGHSLYAVTTASPVESSGEGPVYYLDHAEFQGVDGKTYVEFYLQVGYNALQFYKHGKQFEAGYRLDFSIEDTSGVVVEQSQTNDIFQVDTFNQTLSRTQARVQLLAFTLDAGQYVVKAKLTDRETTKTAGITTNVDVRDFHIQGLQISDIQLSQRIELAKEDHGYVKNQRYIEPNAVRVFSHGLADIYLYIEIYDLLTSENQDSTYTAYLTVHKEDGTVCSQLHLSHVKPAATAAHSLKLPVDYFRAGHYSLTIKVEDNATGEVAENSVGFTVVENQPLSVSEVAPERTTL